MHLLALVTEQYQSQKMSENISVWQQDGENVLF